MEGTTLIHLYDNRLGVIYEAPDWRSSRVVTFRGRISSVLFKLAAGSFVIGIVFLALYILPVLSAATSKVLAETVKPGAVAQQASQTGNQIAGRVVSSYQPKFDASLPTQNKLSIPAIGVNTVLEEAMYDNYESALKKGVWRAPDYGTPFDRSMPTILAAHRFGYLAWTGIFRNKSSFYNLPKLKLGDTVEVIWRQRKYTYEVYAEAKGDSISDYSADLILYTCETLNGPVRIFKYARLLEI